MTPHTARCDSRERGTARTSTKALASLTGVAAVVLLGSAVPASALPVSAAVPLDAPTCQGRVPTIYVGPERAWEDNLVNGTEGDDVIVTVGDRVVIYGNGGDDVICTFGDEGNVVFGGSGNDRIFTTGGEDSIHGDDGADEVHAGAGADEVYGEEGADRLFGDNGSDSIIGDGGDDIMYGGDGSDRIRGRAGLDQGRGGAGYDLCRFATELRESCGTWIGQ